MEVQPIPKPVYKKRRKPKQFKTPAKPYCQYCGSTDTIDPPHHILLKQMGGTWREEVHSEDNAITLCRRCHDKAHQRQPGYLPDDLRKKLEIDKRISDMLP